MGVLSDALAGGLAPARVDSADGLGEAARIGEEVDEEPNVAEVAEPAAFGKGCPDRRCSSRWSGAKVELKTDRGSKGDAIDLVLVALAAKAAAWGVYVERVTTCGKRHPHPAASVGTARAGKRDVYFELTSREARHLIPTLATRTTSMFHNRAFQVPAAALRCGRAGQETSNASHPTDRAPTQPHHRTVHAHARHSLSAAGARSSVTPPAMGLGSVWWRTSG